METDTLAQSINTPDPDWVAVLLRDYCVDQGDSFVSPVSIQLDRFGIDAPKVRHTCENARLAGYYGQEISDAVRHLWAFGMSSHGLALRSMPKAILFAAPALTMQSRPL